jgi:hypothetical protein
LVAEESDVQVIKAPLVRKRKLKKGIEPVASDIEHAAKVIETAASTVKVANVAGFLVAQRKQTPPPFVPRMADVEAFLANEPVMAVLVNFWSRLQRSRSEH